MGLSKDACQPEVGSFHSWAVILLKCSVRSPLWDYRRLAIQIWKRYGKFKEKGAHFRSTCWFKKALCLSPPIRTIISVSDLGEFCFDYRMGPLLTLRSGSTISRHVGTLSFSLWKQPTFHDATRRLPAKWRLRNECWNSLLMMHHYQDLGIVCDWISKFLTNQKHYSNLSSDASLVWNFCSRFSDVISRENYR